MHKRAGVEHFSDSDEFGRLREENQQLQELITNLSVHERMFHSLFELSHDAILLLDGRRVFDCNRTAVELFQTARDELLHTQISSLVKAERYESFEIRLDAAVEIEPQFFETQFVCSDQRQLECEVSAAALRLYRRQFFMVNIRDIT